MGICLTGSIWCREAAASRWWSQDPFRRLATRPTPSDRATLSINMREMDLVWKPGVDPGCSRGTKTDTDLPHQLYRKQSSAFTSSQPQGGPWARTGDITIAETEPLILKMYSTVCPWGKVRNYFAHFLMQVEHEGLTHMKQSSKALTWSQPPSKSSLMEPKILYLLLQMHLIGISGSFPPIHSVIYHIHLVFVCINNIFTIL